MWLFRFPAPFVEEMIPSPLNGLVTFAENQLTQIHGFISRLSTLFHQSMCLCYASTTLSWLLQFCSKFWNWEVWALQLCSFSRLFWLVWVLYISTWILGSACQFLQRSWDFERDCVESVDQLGECCHLNNIKSFDP